MITSLLYFCGSIGIIWYVVCILLLGFRPIPPNRAFYEFMQLSITTIGNALATFVGMVLGFERVNATASAYQSC